MGMVPWNTYCDSAGVDAKPRTTAASAV